MPARVVTQGAQEVDLADVRTEGLHEVELAVRALPQHEVAEALLTRGADDQVGVALPTRVEVLRDELLVDALGQVFEGVALLLMRADDAAHGIRDLGAPPIADRQVDVEPGMTGRAFFGFESSPVAKGMTRAEHACERDVRFAQKIDAIVAVDRAPV